MWEWLLAYPARYASLYYLYHDCGLAHGQSFKHSLTVLLLKAWTIPSTSSLDGSFLYKFLAQAINIWPKSWYMHQSLTSFIYAKVECWMYFIPKEYNLEDKAIKVASILRRLFWSVNWAKLITWNCSMHLTPIACWLLLYLFMHLLNSYLGMSDIVRVNTVFLWFIISIFCNTICKSLKSNPVFLIHVKWW